MFKALLSKLTGATYEVRVISHTTGKDIPGRCLYKGGFWKARKAYLKAAAKLKYGQTLRLQAVSVLFHETNIIPAQEDIWTPEEVQELKDGFEITQPAYDTLGAPVAEPEPEFVTTHVEGEFKDPHDHLCNSQGPMELGKAGYFVPTCDVCGKLNELENI